MSSESEVMRRFGRSATFGTGVVGLLARDGERIVGLGDSSILEFCREKGDGLTSVLTWKRFRSACMPPPV
jgi:hypothetical protein